VCVNSHLKTKEEEKGKSEIVNDRVSLQGR